MRLKQIDGLRFLSFLGVFLYHHRSDTFWVGSYGVSLFFVISGFLITRILFDHELLTTGGLLTRFYARRFLRIFPAYYLVLSLLLLTAHPKGMIWHFTYLFNMKIFFWSLHNPILAVLKNWKGLGYHFWTLCVEEQFYLVYPLALTLPPKKYRLHVLLGFLTVSIALRQLFRLQTPQAFYGALLPVCGEYIAWGCLGGYLSARKFAGQAMAPLILYSGILMFLILIRAGEPNAPYHLLQFYPDYRQTLYGLCFGLLVWGLWLNDDVWISKILSWKPLAFLGKISYGLYLIHPFSWGLLPRLIGERNEASSSLLLLMRLGLTIALATLMWYVVERPILNLKKYFSYAPSGLFG